MRMYAGGVCDKRLETDSTLALHLMERVSVDPESSDWQIG